MQGRGGQGRPGGARVQVLAVLLFGVLLFAGCASGRPALPPPPAPEAPLPALEEGAGDLSAAAVSALARQLLDRGETNMVGELQPRTLNHLTLWASLRRVVDGADGILVTEIGRSVQGRELYAVEFGRGPIRVLLWSQMHGNEPTATLALADLLRFVVENPDEPLVRTIVERLTVVAVPMLNPDGAQRNRRENATGIDINRDARRQSSPEARALAALHARVSPHFGFNLHDQSLRVADDGRDVAISLLAPPHARDPAELAVLTRAKLLAGVMRMAADSLVDGRVTRYDEAYNPQAFGDAMQSWGTSTVLLETGIWGRDPDKTYLRHVNFALLLTALDAIATGSFERVRLQEYETLPGTRQQATQVPLPPRASLYLPSKGRSAIVHLPVGRRPGG
jgi:hypothetical protein